MKRFLITFIIIMLAPIVCFGADDEYNNYLNSFDLSAFSELDEDTNAFLDELGLSEFDYDSITNIDIGDFFKNVWNVVIQKTDGPLKSALIVLCFIMLSSFLQSMSSQLNNSEMTSYFNTVTSLIISIFLVSRLAGCISLACSTIKLCSNFSFAFFPAFCVIVATSGGAATSFSVNTTLLTLSQGLNYLAESLFLPLTNCFLVLGICSGIRQELNIGSLTEALKKFITSIISIISALFVAILSFKTTVASKTDALGLRSARFAINTVVPVIGGTISEGLLSIQSYSSLIKSSVGIVGIIAIVAIFLPSIIEVNMWRFVLSASCVCADVFGNKNSITAIRAFSNSLLIIDVILILSMVTTIISIGILVAARTTA
ncbi:MAG: stage III sporulation protein AE [Clostridium sp.]|nr:stage III sporulation protein AE [Clostridium sp.]